MVLEEFTQIKRSLKTIDETLEGLDEILTKQLKDGFKPIHDELMYATNQLYISRITHLDFHDGEMTYR